MEKGLRWGITDAEDTTTLNYDIDLLARHTDTQEKQQRIEKDRSDSRRRCTVEVISSKAFELLTASLSRDFCFPQ